MNKEIFVKLMNALGKVFDKEMDKELLEIWYSYFAEDNSQEFKDAVNEYIKTGKKFPTIADIKEKIADNRLAGMPKAEDEWNRVIDLVHKYGSYNEEKALSEMNDYTRYIVKHLGFVNICISEDLTWLKKEFTSEYVALKDKQKELIQIDSKEVKLIDMKEMN